MANAKKCDRCGILYEIKYDENRPSYNGQKVHMFSLITTNPKGLISGEYNYDLCPDCACALMSWFYFRQDDEIEELQKEETK